MQAQAITVCLFGGYQYVRLPFGAAQAGDMLQKKIDGLFSSMLNVICMTGAGFDEQGRYQGETLEKELLICR